MSDLVWGIWNDGTIIVLGDTSGNVKYSVALTFSDENVTEILSLLEWLYRYAPTKSKWQEVQTIFIAMVGKSYDAWEVDFSQHHLLSQ